VRRSSFNRKSRTMRPEEDTRKAAPGKGGGLIAEQNTTDEDAEGTMVVNIVWHYTTGNKFQEILESGVLLRDDQTTPYLFAPGEKGFVWFSSNQQWEETANKAAIDEAG